jgi:peptidoglycan hydrolase-like protein with peptidoglycan-binding domain
LSVYGFSTTTGQSCIPNPAASVSSGTTGFTFTLKIQKGSSGNEVLELQKFLNNAGYPCGTPDGKFGAKTKASLIKFQIANNLTGDGSVGAKTRAVLNK